MLMQHTQSFLGQNTRHVEVSLLPMSTTKEHNICSENILFFDDPAAIEPRQSLYITRNLAEAFPGRIVDRGQTTSLEALAFDGSGSQWRHLLCPCNQSSCLPAPASMERLVAHRDHPYTIVRVAFGKTLFVNRICSARPLESSCAIQAASIHIALSFARSGLPII